MSSVKEVFPFVCPGFAANQLHWVAGVMRGKKLLSAFPTPCIIVQTSVMSSHDLPFSSTYHADHLLGGEQEGFGAPAPSFCPWKRFLVLMPMTRAEYAMGQGMCRVRYWGFSVCFQEKAFVCYALLDMSLVQTYSRYHTNCVMPIDYWGGWPYVAFLVD